MAALTSNNISYVYGLEHLDRGYESFETKLVKLGARVERKYIVDSRDQIENFATGNSSVDLKVAWPKRKQH